MITENFENTERTDKTEKAEKSGTGSGNFPRMTPAIRANSGSNRDFDRHGVYTPRNLNVQYGTNKDNSRDNKFRFKNSLIITPHYEIEFHDIGGIKYIKNHENRVFFTNDGIFAMTNNVQKIPVLLKRSINKQSIQKKLIVEEKYNYEEKYEIYKNIILYYEENRVDFQISFNKLDFGSNDFISDNSETDKFVYTNTKDITTEFSLNLSIAGIDNIITYKKYSSKEEYKSLLSELSNTSTASASHIPNIPGMTNDNFPTGGNLEYLMVGCEKDGGACMTVYPDKKLLTSYNSNNKSLCFTTSNVSGFKKNYINLKIYLESYRIT